MVDPELVVLCDVDSSVVGILEFVVNVNMGVGRDGL